MDVIESELENETLSMISWWILEPPTKTENMGVRANQDLGGEMSSVSELGGKCFGYIHMGIMSYAKPDGLMSKGEWGGLEIQNWCHKHEIEL